MSQQIVGVVGAGVMGIGVAHNLAQTGHSVILVDIDQTILVHAKAEISKNLRMQRMLSKTKDMESSDTILNRITFTTDYGLLTDADFVIENATEKWEIKKQIHSLLDEICPSHAVFAINTSAISITRLAAVTKRPAQILGIHFMNPVPLKPVVEVIRGFHTSEETITVTQRLLTAMNKQWVIVNDYPGFVSNRISHLFMNEAAFVVQDQVATPKDVDDIFVKCYGHTMGPLQTADLIGLDTVVQTLDVLYQSYQDPKFRCCPLLQKMVDAGLYGRKSGKGFYTYA
ncbi:3-hydroxyacyl-CoA dehydrogenase family protein [Tengunoibacter tsumagoiensis]|uniref:3-hydroxybutyryl-CoA dehydrogenase n=1 Tax=Tengunoibacter tsumagoiensis TaxID=2014871 RepID=A0A402A905_9CHLR|nr:3-hydroxyacyl-CoA dehydrogenase family protein [Tengunoibacter tsumagoiensis]GCE15664.1 3-hydroxybutyryl-CoA dehydrogenase [Tengunoibacter tsumagoiensis]